MTTPTRIATAILIALPGAAAAHPGHLAEAAGHGHWLGAAAIGAAIAIGLWQGLKGRRNDDDEAREEPEAADEEPQEA